MVLEATIVCVDNSEWMRNGDYPPARIDAQRDAVNLVCSAKIQQNPENTVGLLTTSGPATRILVTSTQDVATIFSSLHDVKLQGAADVIAAVQKAQLALKHRQNQHQRQRIVLFCGSPVVADQESLVKLAKKLKKNGVAVDVVNFGEEADNETKLAAFVDNVSSDSNSHLVSVPPGPHVLSDIILSSPIIAADGAGGPPMATPDPSAPGQMDGGTYVDPSVDPELAMAIRISMQEEQARQEAARQAAEAEAASAAAPSGDAAPATPAADAKQDGTTTAMAAEPQDDDDDLYGDNNADAMEVDTAKPEGTQSGAPPATDPSSAANADELDDDDEDLRLALEMSLQEAQETKKEEEDKSNQ